MTQYQVIAQARLEYDDEEISPESAKENILSMIQSGQITPEVWTEFDEEKQD